MPQSQAVRVRYPDVVLVCRECNGDGKRIAKEITRAVRDFDERPRVMRTSCLDVCPKRDVCIAHVGLHGVRARVIGVEDVETFVAEVAAAR
jgi:hypothetical protein